MFIYLLIDIAATGLAALGTYFRKQSKLAMVVCYCFSALILCYFAGVRGLHVGSDTAGYGYSSYRTALLNSFTDFYSRSNFESWSPLYKCLCWISSKIGRTFFSYLFCIQLFTVIPLYLAALKGLDRYAPFAVLIYCIAFYPMSFNMMRQMIAMSFLLLAFIEANDRRLIRFLIFVLVATGFHESALLGLYIYPLVAFSTNTKSRFSYGLRVVIFTIFSVALIALAPVILRFTDSIGFYSAYTSGAGVTEGGGLRTIVVTIAVGLVLSGLGWIFSRKSNISTRLSVIGLFVVVAFGIICLPLSLISFWLYRIGFYFLYLVVLALPTCSIRIQDRRTKLIYIGLAVFLLLFWSYDYYVIQGSHNVIPYYFATQWQ